MLCYEQEKFVGEAVSSVLAQDYSDMEIIVSDDCSPDKTFGIVSEITSAYDGPHDVIINRNETNLGLSRHYQKAVGMCSGEWIVFAGNEDVSMPNRVSKLMEAVTDRSDVVAAGHGMIVIDEEGVQMPYGRRGRHESGRYDKHGECDWIRRFTYGDDIGLAGCAVMWHRSLFEQFPRISEEVRALDVVLNFRAYLSGSVVYLPDDLIYYRRTSGSVSNRNQRGDETPTEVYLKTVKLLWGGYHQHLTDVEHYYKGKERDDDIYHFAKSKVELLKLAKNWEQLSLSSKLLKLLGWCLEGNFKRSFRYASMTVPPRLYFGARRIARFLKPSKGA
ncbi:MAG: glycosyltransferase [Opitutaceae bacterium]